MRIRQIYLDGFGVFHDRRIVIGRGDDGNQGVVLFTGANEAGKTTLMSFIRGILFGFEGETSRNFYAPGRGGRHGGSLEVEMLDGRVERIVRYAERGQSRQPAAVVGNMSKALYSNVFAFGLAELAVLSSLGSDEVRSRIYSAGAGLGTRSLPEARRKLESKSDSLYRPRGRTPLINAALAEADDLDRRIADLARDPLEHSRLIRAIEQCQAARDEVQASLREARAAEQWYASLDSTRLVWERLCQATAAQGRLGPEDPSCSKLLTQAGAIRELELKLNAYLSVVSSIPALQAEADAMRADHRRLLGQLGTGWDESAVAAFDTSPGVDETVRQMRKNRDALAGAVERAQEALSAREQAAQAAMRQRDHFMEDLGRSRRPDYPDRAAIESRIERIGRCQALVLSVAAAAAKAEAARERSCDLSREAAERAEAAAQARSFAQVWLAPVLISVGSILAALRRPAWAVLLLMAVGAIAATVLARNAVRRTRTADLAARASEDRARQAREHEQQLAVAHRKASEELEAAKAELGKAKKAHRGGSDSGQVDKEGRVGTDLGQVDGVALAALIERARQDLVDWDALARIERDLEQADRECKRAEKDLDAAREALVNACAALEADSDGWHGWLGARGIDFGFSHDGALQTIELIRKAKDAREQLAQAERRAETARDRAREYEEAVDLVLAALGMSSGSGAEPDVETEQGSGARRDGEAEPGTSKKAVGYGSHQAAVDSLVKLSAEAQDLVDKRRRLAAQVEDLKAQFDLVFPTPDRARARADHSSHTAAEIQAALDEAGKRAEAFEAKAGELDRELGSLAQSRAVLESRDELARVGAERAAVQGKLDALLREWAAYCVCLDLVNSACEKYERERQPQVLQDASDALCRMTGGRWPRIIARVAGLESLDVVASDGRVHPHTRLSCGTEQQLYLAVRCGLVREYCSHAEPMPVMVDDVLVNFDPVRQGAAARVLAELCDICQVLVFTCHPHTAEHFRQTGLVAAEFDLEAIVGLGPTVAGTA
ncbi:MAG: AAA family ATPase [Firmicutes bacterium]|nr:AAA family ATPase [Bacillota bacterium]